MQPNHSSLFCTKYVDCRKVAANIILWEGGSEMNSFGDYRANTGLNNLAIQRALREIDTEVLATALVGLSEDIRGMFYT